MDEKTQRRKEYQKKYRALNADKIKQYCENIDSDHKREYNKKYRDNCKRKYDEFMENNPDINTVSNTSIYHVVNDTTNNI